MDELFFLGFVPLGFTHPLDLLWIKCECIQRNSRAVHRALGLLWTDILAEE